MLSARSSGFERYGWFEARFRTPIPGKMSTLEGTRRVSQSGGARTGEKSAALGAREFAYTAPMRRVRPHHLLAAIPVLLLLGTPLLNGLPGYVMGIPIMLAWIVGCVALTSAIMAVLAAKDRESGAPDRRDGESR